MKRKHKERVIGTLLISPSILGVLFFFVFPFLIICIYTMVKYPTDLSFVGFRNYQNVLTNQAFLSALFNTMCFAALAVVLAVIIPLMLAILLLKIPDMQSLIMAFLVSPLTVPVVSVAMIWSFLFDYGGLINSIFQLLHISSIDWYHSKYSIIILMSLYLWKNIGYHMILFLVALSSIPNEVIEAALVDGAKKWCMFFRIKLPYLISTIVFVAVLSIMDSFKIFREAYALTGDYPYGSLYTLQHYMNNQFHSLNYPALSVTAIILLVANMTFIIGLIVIERRVSRDITY